MWRYRYDKLGWTIRSSQLYENRLPRLGSPLFHFGMLGVVGGHVIGLLVSRTWTDAIGIGDHTYHLVAVAGGLVAGVMALAGVAILVYRRRTVGPVFSATTPMEKVKYAVLGAVIALGMRNTIAGSIFTLGSEYNYREGVSVWYRSFLALTPDPSLMARAPIGFRLHALVAFGLFALGRHPARARFHCAPRLPHPSLHRLPQPRCPARLPRAVPGLEAGGLRCPPGFSMPRSASSLRTDSRASSAVESMSEIASALSTSQRTGAFVVTVASARARKSSAFAK